MSRAFYREESLESYYGTHRISRYGTLSRCGRGCLGVRHAFASETGTVSREGHILLKRALQGVIRKTSSRSLPY